MKIYHYNPLTGVFLCADDADPDPLVEGNFLIPAHATSLEPLPPQENKLVVFNGESWEYGEIVNDEVIPDSQGPIDLVINDELTTAYEAIAALFEINQQLLSRLEALENGLQLHD